MARVNLAQAEGTTKLVDCGFIDQVQLGTVGPQTLYTPAGDGEWALLFYSADNFEQGDVDWDVYIGQDISTSPLNYINRYAGADPIDTIKDQITGTLAAGVPSRHVSGLIPGFVDGILIGTSPIVAKIRTDYDLFIEGPDGTWIASNAYTAFDVIQGSDHVLYQAQGGGTSDISQPTWPGNGNTVVDNDITWLGIEDPPSMGLLHAYLLVATL